MNRLSTYWRTVIAKKRGLTIAIVLFVLIPTVYDLLSFEPDELHWYHLFHHVSIWAFLICLHIFVQSHRSRFLTTVLHMCEATYFLSLYMNMVYFLAIGVRLDPLFLADAASDAPLTILAVLNPFICLGIITGLTTLYYGVFSICKKSVLHFSGTHRFHPYIIATALLVAIFLNSGTGLAKDARLLSDVLLAKFTRSTVEPIIPNNAHFKTNSKEHVFIVQLESVSGPLVDGIMELDGRKYSEVELPSLETIAKDGIFFPLMWSNNVQTNRAQVSMLCGIIRNMGKSMSYQTERITNNCLPELLKLSGYRTIFYWSFYQIAFQGRNHLAPKTGFDTLLDGSDLAKEGDIQYDWGYDDCAFYKRSFENLHTQKDEKFLAYFEVSSHHFPFKSQEALKKTHIYAHPQNAIETYANSLRQQDYCLGKFYEYYKEFAPEKSHLIVLADNGWPLQGRNMFIENGATSQHFLMPLVYVPPTNKKEEFKVGSRLYDRVSASDVLPTIFSLLNNTNEPNSFAHLLRTNSSGGSYEDCHLLVQPYGQREIVLVHGDNKYAYSFERKTITHTNLAKDLLDMYPFVIDENISYEEFNERYLCNRYKS